MLKPLIQVGFLLLSLWIGSDLYAQNSIPPNTRTVYGDTSSLKLAPHADMEIIEFEDLECPVCAAVAPQLERISAMDHVPIVRHDFPLTQHHWSRTAAIYLRYLNHRVPACCAVSLCTLHKAIAVSDSGRPYPLLNRLLRSAWSGCPEES